MKILYVGFMIAILASMAVVAAIDMNPDAEARKKGQGVLNTKYGSDTKRIVCGDILCSEITTSEMPSKQSSQTTETKIKPPTMSKPTNGISVDSIMGATVKQTNIDAQSNIVTMSLNSTDDGEITVTLPSIVKDVFMVIVDGEEWDDVYIQGNEVKIYFYAGAEKIEIIGNVLG